MKKIDLKVLDNQYKLHKFEDIEMYKKFLPGYIIFEVKREFSFDGKKYEKGKKYLTVYGIFRKLVEDIENEVKKLNENNNNKFLNLKPEDFIFVPDRNFKNYFKRYNGQDLTNKKICVIKNGGYGDLIFLLPVLQYIKKNFENVTIDFYINNNKTDIISIFPQIFNKVGFLPIEMRDFEKYDYHYFTMYSLEHAEFSKKMNAYEIMRDIAGLKFNIEDYRPELHVFPKLYETFKKMLPDNMVVITVRASTDNRTLSWGVGVELINRLISKGYTVGILDSQDFSGPISSFIKSNFGEGNYNTIVWNLAEYSQDIAHATALIRCAKAFLGTDSGNVNIASTFKDLPTYGIYTAFKGETRISVFSNTRFYNVCNHWNKCELAPCFFHGEETGYFCPYVKKHGYSGCTDTDAVDCEYIVEDFHKFVRDFYNKEQIKE